MNPKQNLGQNWRGILTLCTGTALYAARTGRYPVSSTHPTAPRQRSGWYSRSSPSRSKQSASKLSQHSRENRDSAAHSQFPDLLFTPLL